MRGYKWNIDGVWGLELYMDQDGVVRETRNDKTNILIQGLNKMIAEDSEKTAELVIQFNSTGYYEPASMYGGPDRLGWPEDGADDREVISVTLVIDESTFFITDDYDRDLFEWYREDIEKVELSTDDY